MSEDNSSFLPSYEREAPSSTENDSSSRSTSSQSSRSSSPSPALLAPADDTSIKIDPDRHVDYLSHDWTENDIWVSWRHVTKQKAFLQSGARLENASWRTWAKSRNNLKTISPETLNWLKDCDVTWLYGPLHRGTKFDASPSRSGSDDTLTASGAHEDGQQTPRRDSEDWSMAKPRLESHSSSFVIPSRRQLSKPILKKRSNSEMMLARHNIVSVDSPFTDDSPDEVPLVAGSSPAFVGRRPTAIRSNSNLRSAQRQHVKDVECLDVPKRRIHFNESVEQCISLVKPTPEEDGYDSSSSEDAPTMRISTPKLPINIAKLPSTTLKLPSQVMMDKTNQYLIPTESFSEDNDSDEDHSEYSQSYLSNAITTRSSRSNSGDSAILPNYDGMQNDSPPPGIFGRAAEVVSSARDLVSVIWSASGWRQRPENA